MKLKSLCVYCGSSPGLLPEYADAASTFGKLLAEQGIRVVYGGGNVGLMGAVANGALAVGGQVIGVIPRMLADKELAHSGLTELHTVTSMHERKTKMADLSDAFVALPGGVGTLEEIFEVYTWTQLGFHTKPCAFLNVASFYDPLFVFLRRLVEQRFLQRDHFESLLLESDMGALLDHLRAYEHVAADKWVDRPSRST